MRGLSLVLLLLISMGRAPAQKVRWEIGPWTRASDAPVIRPDAAAVFHDPVMDKTVHWEALNTFNPAAVVRGGKVYVLYRAEDDSGKVAIGQHISRLGLAVSDDGVRFTQMPEPVLYPTNDHQLGREQEGGVEDPRIVEAEDGSYVLTYTQWSRRTGIYSVGIATSHDLRTWVKHGPAFEGADGGIYDRFKYKSAGIVTRREHGRLIAAKVHGKYWMYWGEVEVGLASSDDLIHWTPVESAPGKPLVLLRRREGLSDSGFPETGPPPVLTEHGIVMLYNAKNAVGAGADTGLRRGSYSVQEALFSAQDPARLLARTVQPVFAPELPFERAGQYGAGTTFAEGLVWFRRRWILYYGCADSFVGAATAPND